MWAGLSAQGKASLFKPKAQRTVGYLELYFNRNILLLFRPGEFKRRVGLFVREAQIASGVQLTNVE